MLQNNSDYSRRKVLRTTAAGGVGSAGLFGFSQSATSARQSRSGSGIEDDLLVENGEVVGYDDGEVQMNEPEILEGGQARKEARGAMRNEEVRALRDWFKQQDLRPNVNGAAAFDISYEGEYEEVNQGNPVIVFIPYTPRGKDEQRGGLLQLYMVDDGPQRVVGGVTGTYTEADGESVHSQYLGLDGDDVVVSHEETLDSSFSASWSVKCATCELTFDAICGGTYGVVGLAGCSTICAASGPGWLACTPVCSAMVIVGTAYMCHFGASYFCSNMVDFC